MKELLLAIPCFNEGERLPRFLPSLVDALEGLEGKVCIQIVDDGSESNHHKAIADCIESFNSDLLLPLQTSSKNYGKGSAIINAWRNGEGFRFVAFIDADGSITANDARRLIDQALNSEEQLWIASRAYPTQSKVKRTLFRRFTSRLFNICVSLRYDIHILDTQCGLKIVPNGFIQTLLNEFRQQGFAFDLELLLKAIADDIPITEVPIDWTEKPGGHLSIRAGIGLIWDVLLKRI